MKRTLTTALGLTTVLAASLTGVAHAQTDEATSAPSPAALTVVVTFDQPVLAGYSADTGPDGGAAVSIASDSELRIDLPAGVDVGADIMVTLTSSADPDVAKVSANDASFDELVAALDGVGVSPADRWAREIMEYRPYATDDPTLAHLQDELTKYDPSPETLAGILSVLEP